MLSSRTLHTVLHRDSNVYETRLTGTRWTAGVGMLVLTLFSTRVLGLPLVEGALFLIGVFVLAYNALFCWKGVRFAVPSFRRRILLQIALDWSSLLAFVHFTGGITSPAVVLFFLHVIIVGILLPSQSPYVYAAVISAAMLTMATLEAGQVIGHYRVIPGLSPDLHQTWTYVGAQMAFFTVALGAIAYITVSIMKPLRQREKQLISLYETTRAVNSTLEVADVLTQLADHAARALSARRVAIYLLEPSGNALKLAGEANSNGDSADILPVDAALRRVLDGAIEIVENHNDESAALRTVLVPIHGERALGILRIEGSAARPLGQMGVGYVRALAGQGAVAIQHAMAHEALRDAEKRREQFVHVVTHELRAPVVGAQSLVRLLTGGLTGEMPDQQRDIVERLSKRMDGLLLLINDLLSLAATRSREMHQPLSAVGLQPILSELIETYKPLAQEKRIALTLEPFELPMVVLGTPEGLTRVFDNLIGNAVKYTREDGRVCVSARVDGRDVVVEVRDTGIGIPPDALAALGQEFYRAPNAKAAGVVGTGLGLATVKQMIARFGGILEIESEVDVGSTFRVKLPLAAARV